MEYHNFHNYGPSKFVINRVRLFYSNDANDKHDDDCIVVYTYRANPLSQYSVPSSILTSDISVPDIISVSVSVQFRGNNSSYSSVSVLNIISVSISVFNK